MSDTETEGTEPDAEPPEDTEPDAAEHEPQHAAPDADTEGMGDTA
jgi:hypothetical protein